MTEGIADCMPLALRSVGDAIRLDSENRTKVCLPLVNLFSADRDDSINISKLIKLQI